MRSCALSDDGDSQEEYECLKKQRPQGTSCFFVLGFSSSLLVLLTLLFLSLLPLRRLVISSQRYISKEMHLTAFMYLMVAIQRGRKRMPLIKDCSLYKTSLARKARFSMSRKFSNIITGNKGVQYGTAHRSLRI
ncbi:hypothetical protein KP509_12G055100 [Ceratopteris richardii]|uniref:Uncharacterized protein n=1 Tax=Ceratopteris richardii TaxID=49495 RepID=A0A8T2TNQ6_CERRI|nr:hypothetical protein KP509_12G055100 [Ceratopteris richardii]